MCIRKILKFSIPKKPQKNKTDSYLNKITRKSLLSRFHLWDQPTQFVVLVPSDPEAEPKLKHEQSQTLISVNVVSSSSGLGYR